MGLVNSIKIFRRYLYLLQQLVLRDFKVKYKRSVLGVLWSVLNPLLMMVLLSIVFGIMTKGIMPGVNYPVYLLSGMVIFNYFNEATSLSMGAVVTNFNLITKVYMPKYIFPMSKVFSSALNLFFSLFALYLVILVEKVPVTPLHLLLPFDFICVILFSLGIGLFLSALTVFFRDMYYIYGVIITAWMYYTPILYPLSMIKNGHARWLPLFKINPLYYYVDFAHNIISLHVMPSFTESAICVGYAALSLLIGALFFRWKQDRFVYYI